MCVLDAAMQVLKGAGEPLRRHAPTPTYSNIPDLVYSNTLDGDTLSENNVTKIPVFGSLFDLSFSDLVDTSGLEENENVAGNALHVLVRPGQGSLFIVDMQNPIEVEEDSLVLARAEIWCSNDSARISFGLADTDQNGNMELGGGSLGLEQFSLCKSFDNKWGTAIVLHRSQSGYVIPLIQVICGDVETDTYIDGVKVYQVKEGDKIPAELL